MTKVINLKSGGILINEGDLKQDLYWVQVGELEVIQNRKNYEVILDTVKAGELIGEMSPIDHLPRSATIRAKSECEIIMFSAEEIDQILVSQPQIIKILLNTLVERLRKTSAKVND